jgi:hypothetical protein
VHLYFLAVRARQLAPEADDMFLFTIGFVGVRKNILIQIRIFNNKRMAREKIQR